MARHQLERRSTRGAGRRPFGFAARAILSLAAALSVLTVAQGAGRPQIVVRFEVTSQLIKDGLRTQAQRSAFEQTIANHLAQRVGARYGFVAWNATEEATAPVLGRLTARLADGTTDEMPPIVVQWFYQRGTEAEAPLLSLLPIEIYKKNDPNVDASDRALLERQTLAMLDERVPADAFMNSLFANFIARVPLASRVTTLPEKRVVELPLKGAEVPIGQQSVMQIEFNKPTDGGRQQGMVELRRFVLTDSGLLHAGVEKATVNTEQLQLTDHWNAALPMLLAGSSVQCFLTEYEPDRSIGAIVTEPQ